MPKFSIWLLPMSGRPSWCRPSFELRCLLAKGHCWPLLPQRLRWPLALAVVAARLQPPRSKPLAVAWLFSLVVPCTTYSKSASLLVFAAGNWVTFWFAIRVDKSFVSVSKKSPFSSSKKSARRARCTNDAVKVARNYQVHLQHRSTHVKGQA